MTALMLSLLLAADLAAVRAEQNLEKRSEKALENAAKAINDTRDAYNAGNIEKSKTSLDEVRESVELSYESLKQTGKDPRRSPKHFKRAELKTREFLRRLTGLADLFSFEDRDAVHKVRHRIQEIHDELLTGILTKKKK